MSPRLPFEVREAMVQVFGKAFWLKDPLRAFLTSAGVAPEMYDRYAEESKFKIARHILSDLDSLGDDGWLVKRRIVTELCKLRRIPDSAVADRDAALAALRYLKEVATAHQLLVAEQQDDASRRQQESKRRQAALAARAKKTDELRAAFAELATSKDDPQGRGYNLEDLLAELFELHDISYRRPYRTATEQIDGHFEFKGFDYLVEARWRLTQPTEGDLAAFKIKVDKKISSTRGLFVSIPGFQCRRAVHPGRNFEHRADGWTGSRSSPRRPGVAQRCTGVEDPEGRAGRDHLRPAGSAIPHHVSRPSRRRDRQRRMG